MFNRIKKYMLCLLFFSITYCIYSADSSDSEIRKELEIWAARLKWEPGKAMENQQEYLHELFSAKGKDDEEVKKYVALYEYVWATVLNPETLYVDEDFCCISELSYLYEIYCEAAPERKNELLYTMASLGRLRKQDIKKKFVDSWQANKDNYAWNLAASLASYKTEDETLNSIRKKMFEKYPEKMIFISLWFFSVNKAQTKDQLNKNFDDINSAIMKTPAILEKYPESIHKTILVTALKKILNEYDYEISNDIILERLENEPLLVLLRKYIISFNKVKLVRMKNGLQIVYPNDIPDDTQNKVSFFEIQKR